LHGGAGHVPPHPAIEYKHARAANNPEPAEELNP
jgi:hypothetical protein